MCSTCDNVLRMSKMIQIRNVPDELHRKLKARAAAEGMTLSDYLRAEIERGAAVPTPDEIKRRLRSLPPLELSEPPHAVLRRMRDSDG
jgi:antitoxin FitA